MSTSVERLAPKPSDQIAELTPGMQKFHNARGMSHLIISRNGLGGRLGISKVASMESRKMFYDSFKSQLTEEILKSDLHKKGFRAHLRHRFLPEQEVVLVEAIKIARGENANLIKKQQDDPREKYCNRLRNAARAMFTDYSPYRTGKVGSHLYINEHYLRTWGNVWSVI